MTDEAAELSTIRRLALLTVIQSALRRHQEVLSVIAGSVDRSSANEAVRSLLNVDRTQADALLDLGWNMLTRAGIQEIEDEIFNLRISFDGTLGPLP